jgi:hypothetical protein
MLVGIEAEKRYLPGFEFQRYLPSIPEFSVM